MAFSLRWTKPASQRFARLFVILAFPFWFPRMVFWLVTEFFRLRFESKEHDYLNLPAHVEGRQAGAEMPATTVGTSSAPVFSSLPGGNAAVKNWEKRAYPEVLQHRRRSRLRENGPGLRLLQGGLPSEPSSPKVAKNRRQYS